MITASTCLMDFPIDPSLSSVFVLPLTRPLAHSFNRSSPTPPRLCITTPSCSPATAMADSPVRPAKDIQVWGHRGASAFLPENT